MRFYVRLEKAMVDFDLNLGSTFNPHMTLLHDTKRHAEVLAEPISWTVREFALIKSWRGKTYHEHVRHWSLGYVSGLTRLGR